MKKKILITAFEPFAGRRRNASLDVMALLRAASFKNCRLFKAKLPVSGKAVGGKIRGLLSKLKPDFAVSLGLAAGEAAVRIERFALNVQDYALKDNAGYKPKGRLICAGGPAAYLVNSRPVRLAAAVKKAGVPARVSNHAGTYVCNHLMYEAMSAIAEGGLKTKFAFIHLPLSAEMAALEKPAQAVPPSLPLRELAKAVEAAIRALTQK